MAQGHDPPLVAVSQVLLARSRQYLRT